MKLCLDCKKRPATPTGKTGRCRNCAYSARNNHKTQEGRESIRLSKLGNKNPSWKGDNVGYSALHNWVRRRLPKPGICPDCNERPPLDLANKGVYDRNLNNWEWLCRHCHMQKDGRSHRLTAYSVARMRPNIECEYCKKVFKPSRATVRFCKDHRLKSSRR